MSLSFLFAMFGVLQPPLLFLLVSYSVNNLCHGTGWESMEIFGKLREDLVFGVAATQHFAVN